LTFGDSKYWKDFTTVQSQINNNHQLNRDQKIDLLLFIILSDENPKNWIAPIEVKNHE
jgi:hypothetical protein